MKKELFARAVAEVGEEKSHIQGEVRGLKSQIIGVVRIDFRHNLWYNTTVNMVKDVVNEEIFD